jgi:hypothetical protein
VWIVTEPGEQPPDFPKPVADLAMGLVWYWPEIERWAKATGRPAR